MSVDTASPGGAPSVNEDSELKQGVSGRQLYFYVLGDVLGSGIYVLIGLVAGAVGGAFWAAFAVGVTVATITGLAYAELVTKYPQAAGAALYVNKAFRNRTLTFFITFCMLSASYAAAGSLATGFAQYFGEVWDAVPALVVALCFVLALALVNFIGITESVVANMVMTLIELSGLLIVLGIGVAAVVQDKVDLGRVLEFSTEQNPALGLLAGVALAFFAMTGFENAANVAEETRDPHRDFPRALIGGMATAGVLYVLVAVTAASVVPIRQLAESDAALLEVVQAGFLPFSVAVVTVLFAIIAMIAITNTCLVCLVTESRILYGMAREDVVPAPFARVSSRQVPWLAILFSLVVIGGLLVSGADLAQLANVTVVFTLLIYALVIISAMKLDGQGRHERTFRAPRVLLVVGVVANVLILGYVIYDDPGSLLYCAALLGVGLVLFVVERLLGGGTPTTDLES